MAGTKELSASWEVVQVIRVEVPDAASASGLVRRLTGAFEPTSVVLDANSREVRVEENGKSRRAVARILSSIEVWLREADVDSTTVWLGDAQYTVARPRVAATNGASVRAIIDFRVDVERVGASCAVIALAGEVDMYTAPAVESELLRVIDAGACEVVVDLTGASFIDASLLRVLTRAHKQLHGRLSIVSADSNLTRLFEITGLDSVFAIHAARARATRKRAVV